MPSAEKIALFGADEGKNYSASAGGVAVVQTVINRKSCGTVIFKTLSPRQQTGRRSRGWVHRRGSMLASRPGGEGGMFAGARSAGRGADDEQGTRQKGGKKT